MRRRSRGMKSALAVVLLATVSTPVALAVASGPQARGSSTRAIFKQINALRKTIAPLAAEVTALQVRAAELEEREPAANSLPIGPAGGDLSDTYPNPTIREGAITSASLLNGTLLSSDFAVGSVQPSKIADQVGSAQIQDTAIDRLKLTGSSVGGPQLGSVHVVKERIFIANNSADATAVSCPAGERLISGGAEWEPGFDASGNPRGVANLYTLASLPDTANPNQWDVHGQNSSGITRTFYAVALCLKAS
jgi:hypothetical protein